MTVTVNHTTLADGSFSATGAVAWDAAHAISGTVPIANGGTNGTATPTAGAVPYGDGTSYNFTAAGTLGQVLTSAGAGVPTWATPTTGTVTTVGFTGGLITVATPTTTPAFTVAGTSGGIVYFTSASTWATSAILAANALVVGGGAGATPATVTTGTGVLTALGVNTGSAGAFVINNAANTFTATNTFFQVNYTVNVVTVTTNAGTVAITNRLNNFTNSSAATMTITMATASAVDGQMSIVRIYDFSAVAQTITWVNTENSTVTATATSNGSTTLPLTVGFMYNSQTSKWRCIASA